MNNRSVNAASGTDAAAAPAAGQHGSPSGEQRVRRVTGVVLAGGLGRRMGGVEKGLIPLRGRPLLMHVIDRVRPQVDDLLLNANREVRRYEAFGLPVIGDAIDGLVGPLAGIHAGLVRATHDLVLSVPCDAPSLPDDLAHRLLARMEAADAEIAIARSRGRIHPVFCLCRRELAPELARYLESGGRAVLNWVESRRFAVEDFDDAPEAFENINTPEDVDRLESQ
jgi:molybdopterin-guanine dinucleotide biosynthesis protein A